MTRPKLFPPPQVRTVPPQDLACDVLVCPVFQKSPLVSAAKDLDRAWKGFLGRRIQADRFEGEEEKMLWIPLEGRPAERVLLVGLGERKDLTRGTLRNAYGHAAREILARKIGKVGLPYLAGAGLEEHFDAAVEGFLLRTYRFFRYLKTGDPAADLKSIEIPVAQERAKAKVEKMLPGVCLGTEAVFLARDLVNEPANVMTPEFFASAALEISKERKLRCKVLDEADLRKMGMNLILAVGTGSEIRPRFLHLEYVPKAKAKRTIAWVGKGVTFDSGGLSLKPQEHMIGMKSDMAGAAAVLAAMWAVSELKPPVHVHGLIPLVENLPSGHSTKPGDVIRGYSGKTVEIENTDAEGRLILADALAYAAKIRAEEIVDVATLTGSCMVALGEDIGGILSRD